MMKLKKFIKSLKSEAYRLIIGAELKKAYGRGYEAGRRYIPEEIRGVVHPEMLKDLENKEYRVPKYDNYILRSKDELEGNEERRIRIRVNGFSGLESKVEK